MRYVIYISCVGKNINSHSIYVKFIGHSRLNSYPNIFPTGLHTLESKIFWLLLYV